MRGTEADGEMGEECEQPEAGTVTGDIGRDRVVVSEADGGVAVDGDEDGSDEERELDPAPLGQA